MSTTEVELQLRLDPDYRTTFDPQSNFSSSSSSSSSSSPTENDTKPTSTIDYSSKTVLTLIADPSCENNDESLKAKQQQQKLLDDILFDCEITDCALLPRTFWMPCTGMEPRCTLEKCAMEVFHHHVKGKNYDPSTSGAEWWVQIRPSPSAGRYKLLVQDDNNMNDTNNDKKAKQMDSVPQEGKTSNENPTDTKYNQNDNDIDHEKEKKTVIQEETTGICFHWDKDEDLRLLMDGKMYIHPHISTVTYLSNIGAPTMALNYRVNAFTGEFIIPNNEVVEGYLSWPKKGKHLSFDGRYLHGAPSNLMKKGFFEEQLKVPNDKLSSQKDKDHDDAKKKEKKILERRYRRVTFLVNIWLNYKPFNVNTFPESMIDKLSKTDENVLFQNNEKNQVNENEPCVLEKHTYDDYKTVSNRTKYTDFEWRLGSSSDEKESLSMSIPLELIQDRIGGNIKLTWPAQKDLHHGINLSKGRNYSQCPEQNKKQRID